MELRSDTTSDRWATSAQSAAVPPPRGGSELPSPHELLEERLAALAVETVVGVTENGEDREARDDGTVEETEIDRGPDRVQKVALKEDPRGILGWPAA
jgi:hypothetical protein